jgi:hypothetical protein
MNSLALQVGLDDFVLEHQSQGGLRTVQQEYLSYTASLTEDRLDPLVFWEVQILNFQFTRTLADSSLPDKEDGVPNHIPDGNGLFTNSGLCCSL